ncbi:MAG: hypothetical protein N2053_12005, partial [Chitinispirillaceae bacterium]|nr:hypothetical protein [Chitinispirillaceae bacterium]
MLYRTFFSLFLLLVFNVLAQKINIRGKVTNQGGKPISKAIVNLLHQKLVDTTAADGSYELIANNVNTLQPEIILNREKVLITQNGIMEFSLYKNSNLKIEIYDVRGKVTKEILFDNISAGIYRLNILNELSNSKLFLIRVKIDNSFTILKYIPLQKRFIVTKKFLNNISQHNNSLSKIAEIIDSLRASASGYQTKTLPLSSYDTTVNIVLDSITENKCEGCG